MIKNVVFDLGRVLIRYQPKDYLKSLGYDDEKIKEIHELIFGNKIWIELDRGTYTFAQAKEAFQAMNPQLAHDVDVVLQDGWFDIMEALPDSVAFLTQLKKDGYKIYFLSNFSGEGFAYVEKKYDFFKLGDGKVISAHIHMVKPESGIYQYLLDEYSLVPEETVFIDDLEVNIAAAEAFGIQTILFTDLDEVKEKFAEIK